MYEDCATEAIRLRDGHRTAAHKLAHRIAYFALGEGILERGRKIDNAYDNYDKNLRRARRQLNDRESAYWELGIRSAAQEAKTIVIK